MKETFIETVQGRAFEYAVISTADIVFSAELLKACAANLCGSYNTCWTCPPAVPPLEKQKEKITSFTSAFVFTTRGCLDDSFDFEGMAKAKQEHDILTAEMHEKFGKTNPVFGAGGCKVCESCAYPEPCRFPEKTYTSLEASGINVTDLSRAGGIHYNNGQNTVTYFSMVLFNE